jgi:hypothetical protein
MENDDAAAAVAAYERAIEAGDGEPRHKLGFRLLPWLRDLRLSTAAAMAAWGAAGLLSTTVPDLVANRNHVLLVGEVGLRKHRPRPPTLETLGLHTASVSRENPSLHEH